MSYRAIECIYNDYTSSTWKFQAKERPLEIEDGVVIASLDDIEAFSYADTEYMVRISGRSY